VAQESPPPNRSIDVITLIRQPRIERHRRNRNPGRAFVRMGNVIKTRFRWEVSWWRTGWQASKMRGR
jgi:hypothetical protein